MGVSTHEMLLILRARDEASKVLRNIEGNIVGLSAAQEKAARKQIAQGAALATVGVGIAAAGAVGLKFFADSVGAATEYNRAVALTRTQVDDARVSLKSLSDMGLLVARTVPVAFDQIQPMLYDIFSSMNVNVPQAGKLLAQFARDAVGGQVDLQEAGRATITIMNAWRLPITQVTSVSDTMFQLVRKGVGTYGEFASTIGRSIPSAVRAGQSFQTLAGMLAFLTRNGLSTAQATTSAARALDALSNPKTVDKMAHFGTVVADAIGKPEAIRLFGRNFEHVGIQMKDAHGNFRPMPAIMKDLAKAIGGLPAPQRASVLYELFKGSGGTIQARRFFDIVIPNIKSYTSLSQQLYNTRGAAAQAYQTMLATPAMQAQLLKNNFDALRVEIGNYLLPIFTTLLAFGNKMFKLWDSMPVSVRRVIVIIAAVTAAFTLVVGIVTAVAGVFLMLQGAAALAGTSLGAVLAPILLVVAAVMAVGAALIYAYTHSENFRKFVNNLGSALLTAGKAIVSAIQASFTWIVDTAIPWLQNAWANVANFLRNTWNNMVGWWNTATSAISRIAHAVFDPVITWLRGLLQSFQDWYAKHAEQLHRLWEYVTTAWRFLTEQFGRWILPFLRGIWDMMSSYVHFSWNVMSTIIRGAWMLIQNFLQAGFVWLKVTWNILWAAVGATVRVAWSIIYNTLAAAWHIISGAFSIFLDLITGHWKTAWEDAKRMVSSVWGNIKSIFSTWAREALGLLKTVGSNLLEGLKNGVLNIMRNIGGWLKNNIVDPIIKHVKSFFGISSPSTVFAEIGGHMISGLIQGLMHDPKALVGKIFGGMPSALAAIVGKGLITLQQLPTKAIELLNSVPGFQGTIPVQGGGNSQNRILGQKMAALMGWTGSNWASLNNLWMGESGWNQYARNASSGAYGIPQALPASKMASAGGDWLTNAVTQIKWGLNYIREVYGSPSNAYAKWLSRSPHWYGAGTGFAQPGWAIVGDRGPELMYMGGGERILNNQEASRVSNPSKSVIVNQTIYTNEINPRAHGAALAWEVATKVA